MSKSERSATPVPAVGAQVQQGVRPDPERPTIWERRGLLDKERRDFMKKAMADFDVGHYRRVRALQQECGIAGHHWRFTHLGPVGHPWFACSHCHKSEARDA
jgi:hypothetical protein